jgi:hypothetical protein
MRPDATSIRAGCRPAIASRAPNSSDFAGRYDSRLIQKKPQPCRLGLFFIAIHGTAENPAQESALTPRRIGAAGTISLAVITQEICRKRL